MDIIIIGAGITGLATAWQLMCLKPELKILVIEKEKTVAVHQSGHNSGVIHSGIYYKPGSLKAQNCLKGYQELLNFCQNENIRYELCGKVIVAKNNLELPYLENLFQRGKQNGLSKIRIISKEELKEYEPNCHGIAAIQVPYTGIIDYREVSQKYAQKFQENGGNINFNEKVMAINYQEELVELITDRSSYQTKFLINCAGLYSDKIATLTGINPPYRIIPFRGEYYKLKNDKSKLVNNLIYPVPDPDLPFLGVHFTRMISGEVEAGPNAVLAFKREAYKKGDFAWNETMDTLTWPGFWRLAGKYWQTGIEEMYRSWSKRAFTRALQELLPMLAEDDLEEGGAGVRAQACDRKGNLIDDFLILEEKQAIHLGNAPSPAATSSLAIGQELSRRVLQKLN